MPQRKGTHQGGTPLAHQGFKSGAKKAKLNELRLKTLDLALKSAADHVVSLQHSAEAITDPQWAADMRLYLDYLIAGRQLPAHVRKRLSEASRRLAREWVETAREATGLKRLS